MSAIEAISGAAQAALATPTTLGAEQATAAPQVGFGDMIERGIAQVEQKVDTANDLVRAFAVDDSIPVHQVTIALEQARLAVDLALQVRTRLVEGYRELMNMQL